MPDTSVALAGIEPRPAPQDAPKQAAVQLARPNTTGPSVVAEASRDAENVTGLLAYLVASPRMAVDGELENHVSTWSNGIRLSNAEIERLLKESPEALANMIDQCRLRTTTLSFAAEALGRHGEFPATKRLLRLLLGHPSPLVREGAIYGTRRLMDPSFRSTLSAMANSDPSVGVRTAAREALEE